MASVSQKNKPEQALVKPVSWAQACRDVLVASINKGQLPWVVIGIMGVIAALRVPEEALGRLLEKIVEDLHTAHLLGWALSVIATVAWFLHSRYQTRVYSAELERVSEEKTRLQAGSLPAGLVRSSEEKR